MMDDDDTCTCDETTLSSDTCDNDEEQMIEWAGQWEESRDETILLKSNFLPGTDEDCECNDEE